MNDSPLTPGSGLGDAAGRAHAGQGAMSTRMLLPGQVEPAMRSASLSLAALGRTAGRAVPLAALVAVLATGLAILAMAWVPQRYRSEATILVRGQPAAMPIGGLAPQTPPGDATDAELATQIDALTSAPVLDDAAIQLHLDADPQFNPSLTRGGWLNAVAAKLGEPAVYALTRIRLYFQPVAFLDPHHDVLTQLAKSITVGTKGTSRTVSVQAVADDPWTAANIANAVANASVARELAGRSDYNRRLEDWLGQRLADLRESVSRGGLEIERLRAATGRLDGQAGTILVEQLSQVSRDLTTLQSQLNAAEARRREIQRLGAQGGLAASADVLASPTIRDLRDLEAKLSADGSSIEAKYGAQHPQSGLLRARLAEVRARLAAETERVTREVGDRMGVLHAQIEAQEQVRLGLQRQIEQQATATARLRDLQRQADDDRATFAAFAIFRAKLDGLPQVERPRLEILSPAVPAPMPEWPNRRLVVLVTLFGGFLLVIAAAMIRASMDQGLRTAEQVGLSLGLPVVGLIPLLRGGKERQDPAETALHAPTSPISEAVRHLYAFVASHRNVVAPLRVLVCSALPLEGKSTTSLMLARQASLMGARTLLVRLDLWRSEVPSGSSPGGFLAVTEETDTGLAVASIRRSGYDPLRLLYLPAFWEELEQTGASYDLVVYDTSPMLAVSDVKVIARFARPQLTLLTVKWGATRTATVEEALRQLRAAGTEVQGIVLTQADPRDSGEYSAGYSGRASRGTALAPAARRA